MLEVLAAVSGTTAATVTAASSAMTTYGFTAHIINCFWLTVTATKFAAAGLATTLVGQSVIGGGLIAAGRLDLAESITDVEPDQIEPEYEQEYEPIRRLERRHSF